MSQLQVIRNKRNWDALISNFSHLDIYYSYEYGSLFAQVEGGELWAAYLETEDSMLFYPFIKRKVPHIKEDVFDIVTPYGYGGPFIEGDKTIIVDFYAYFTQFCKDNKIITETIRCHPLINNESYLKMKIDTQYIRKTTAVDLTQSIDKIRRDYSSMNKRNIKKAIDLGVTSFVAEPTESNIKKFFDLYYETMDRNQASKYYYFPLDYFHEQVKTTLISSTYLLFSEIEGEIIAGVMVIIGKDFAHYHLGASKTSHLNLRPNNLLFDFMISFCKQKGSLLLHLGGGYGKDDGLFKFKTSFTNNTNFDYFIGRKIHHPSLYNKITNDIRDTYEVNEQYFPIYRAVKGLKKSSIEVQ